MTINDYINQIKDYTANMLNYEKSEVEDTIKYLIEDEEDYKDDKILLKKVTTNLAKSRTKEKIINIEINRRQ